MEQKERRKVDRVRYPANGVVVVCDTQEKLYVRVKNVSPLGVGLNMPPDSPCIQGKDIIIVTETMIMYADVLRQEKQEDGSYEAGISAKQFTDDVLQYLFDNIAPDVNEEKNKQEGQ